MTRRRGLINFFIIVLVAGLILPWHGTHALVGELLFGNVNTLFASALAIIFTTLGKLLAGMVTAMGWALNLRIYTNIPVIEAGWKIMRDFANMLFIIALVVMAYGTIFNIPGYDFRSLIPRFLFAALMINFSLVIGGMIIDGTQVLNNTFLNAMGDIAGRLGQGLNPADLFPPGTDIGNAKTIADQIGSSIITLFFSIFLVFTFLVSVSVPLVFAFVRIPILWALLIVSPAVWLLSVLPATKKTYDNWWHQFLGWNLFLPYYLFFLYFALFLLSKKNEVLQGLGQEFVSSELVGLQSNFTFGLLFYYVLIAVFLIGGTKVAMSASTFSGTGIVGVAKWANRTAKRNIGVYVPRKGFVSLGAAEQAAKEKWSEIQSKPLPGLEAARGLIGVKGSEFKTQKEFVSKMEQEIAKIRDQEVAGKTMINEDFRTAAAKENRSTPKGAAMRAMLYERGMVDPAEFDKDMAEWTRTNPFLAQKMNELAKKGKYKRVPGKQLNDMYTAQAGTSYEKFRVPGATASRKDWFSFAVEDDDALKSMDINSLSVGVSLMGGKDSNEGKEKLKAVGKKRPDIVAEFKLREDGITPSTIQLSRYIFKEIKNKDPKSISEMLESTWSNTAFQDALRRKAALLQRLQPPQPAIPRGAPGGPRKAFAGGGAMFRSNLMKSVQNHPRKLAIARTI